MLNFFNRASCSYKHAASKLLDEEDNIPSNLHSSYEYQLNQLSSDMSAFKKFTIINLMNNEDNHAQSFP